MPHGRLLHPLMQARPDRGMGPMLVLSVAVHLLVALFFSGWLAAPARREERPVYYVDLINRPVANPQAGRPDGGGGGNKGSAKEQPDARPQSPPKSPLREEAVVAPAPAQKTPAVALPAKTESKPEAKAITPARPATKPETKAKSDSPAQPKPEVKAAAEAKTAAAAKKVEKDYQRVLSAVADLQKKRQGEQRQQEVAALQERIAEMARRRGDSGAGAGSGGTGSGGTAAGAGQGSGVAAPLGMPDGKGNEAGVSSALWLQTYFRANWRLSRYQVSRPDLETVIHIAYDADGNLLKKEIVKSSGDRVFDQSVEDAVLRSKKLPMPLPGPFKEDVIFNLRELQQ